MFGALCWVARSPAGSEERSEEDRAGGGYNGAAGVGLEQNFRATDRLVGIANAPGAALGLTAPAVDAAGG